MTTSVTRAPHARKGGGKGVWGVSRLPCSALPRRERYHAAVTKASQPRDAVDRRGSPKVRRRLVSSCRVSTSAGHLVHPCVSTECHFIIVPCVIYVLFGLLCVSEPSQGLRRARLDRNKGSSASALHGLSRRP